MGDLNIVYPVLGHSYTFHLKGMKEPVKLNQFKKFFVQFRKDAAAAGGPAVGSNKFMMFQNVIRRKVKKYWSTAFS